jgi:drug/metabolite transporter (DMT)-like permease
MWTTMHRRGRWWIPLFSLGLGGVILAAFAIGGNVGDGLLSFGVLAGLAAVFAFSGRSETLSGLGGPGRDERWSMIDLRASAASGLALIGVLIGCWLYELARGHDGSPYGELLAVGGIAYIVAIGFLRWRS